MSYLDFHWVCFGATSLGGMRNEWCFREAILANGSYDMQLHQVKLRHSRRIILNYPGPTKKVSGWNCRMPTSE